MEAVTDNPIIFCDTDEVISGGNFHGQPMALPSDFLGIAISEMANVSERRIERLVNPALNNGLPAFLVKNGGAFQKMITPFKLGLGGIIGSGKQHFSYIHIEDLMEVYKFVIENSLDGVFNCTAPTPTTNYEFTKTLGRVLNRPTIFPIPEFVLKLIFSEGAKVLTDGQSVIPKRLLDLGFNFKYKNIDETLKNLAK